MNHHAVITVAHTAVDIVVAIQCDCGWLYQLSRSESPELFEQGPPSGALLEAVLRRHQASPWN